MMRFCCSVALVVSLAYAGGALADGVIGESVLVGLGEGRVRLDVQPGIELSDEMLARLFRNAGFTYRGKTIEALRPED